MGEEVDLHHEAVRADIMIAMIRTQISLTEKQMRRLRRASRERGVSIAALVREAVDRALPEADDELMARQRRAFGLAGAFASGHPDTAERHDDVLAEPGGW
jgi:hypothetical protein